MAIDPELLEILACPVCKVSVTLTRDGSGLLCGKCLRLYPIVDDIPVMLVEDAVLVKKANISPKRKGPKAGRKATARAKPKAKAKAKAKPRPKPKLKLRRKPKPKSKARLRP